jgi:hypothetical protein
MMARAVSASLLLGGVGVGFGAFSGLAAFDIPRKMPMLTINSADAASIKPSKDGRSGTAPPGTRNLYGTVSTDVGQRQHDPLFTVDQTDRQRHAPHHPGDQSPVAESLRAKELVNTC